MNLNLVTVKLRLRCKTITPIKFPYFPGNTLRGALGYTLRRTTCLSGKENCASCQVQERCVYAYVFESIIPEGETKISAQSAPHPFVIEAFNLSHKIFKQGDEWFFDLILIGKAINLYHFFIHAFEKIGCQGLGEVKGTYKIISVEDSYSRSKVEYTQVGLNSFSISPNPTKSEPKSEKLLMEIITPLRLVSKGKTVMNIPFHEILRHGMRRITNLQYFHGSNEHICDVNFKELLELSKNVLAFEHNVCWEDIRRFSTRQKKHVPLGGTVGRVVYGEGWRDYWPWLAIIEQVHLGKNCTFGLGQIRFSGFE